MMDDLKPTRRGLLLTGVGLAGAALGAPALAAGQGGGVAVTTSLAEHLELLDSQNTALLGLLEEERRVEEALNLDLATAAK